MNEIVAAVTGTSVASDAILTSIEATLGGILATTGATTAAVVALDATAAGIIASTGSTTATVALGNAILTSMEATLATILANNIAANVSMTSIKDGINNLVRYYTPVTTSQPRSFRFATTEYRAIEAVISFSSSAPPYVAPFFKYSVTTNLVNDAGTQINGLLSVHNFEDNVYARPQHISIGALTTIRITDTFGSTLLSAAGYFQ